MDQGDEEAIRIQIGIDRDLMTTIWQWTVISVFGNPGPGNLYGKLIMNQQLINAPDCRWRNEGIQMIIHGAKIEIILILNT